MKADREPGSHGLRGPGILGQRSFVARKPSPSQSERVGQPMNEPSAGWPAERGRDALSKRALVGPVSSTTLSMLCLLPVSGFGRADGLGDPLWINLKLVTPSRSSLGAAASMGLPL